jgi:Pentapeptide repeats (8 copies)
MTSPAGLDFSNQNLRDRTFANQLLTAANFSGADLRGGNFRHSQLVGANFTGAKVGLSPWQMVRLIGLMGGIAGVIGDALTRLMFGALGQTPETPAWLFVLLLSAVLMLAGLAVAVSAVSKTRLGRWSSHLGGILAGALVGFFYAGQMAANNPLVALLGMGVGGIMSGICQLRIRRAAMLLTTATATVVMTYGATFWLSATASLYLSTQHWLMGSLVSLTTLMYLGFTLMAMQRLQQAWQRTVGTSFWGANLTDASFDRVPLKNTDFSHTVGYNQ